MSLMPSMIRVVVADDEEGYRKAIRQILSTAPDIELVGLASNGEEALRMSLAGDVDVLLTDVEMPKMNGIECIEQITKRKRDVNCVVLTVHEDSESVFQAVRAGAIGYLLKTSTPKDVVDAIRSAKKGEALVTPSIASKVLEEFRRQAHDEDVDDEHLYELSDRELQILELVAKGLRNKEIAQRLCLAEKTVKNHVSNILKALQVNSRTEAAMKAIRERIVGN